MTKRFSFAKMRIRRRVRSETGRQWSRPLVQTAEELRVVAGAHQTSDLSANMFVRRTRADRLLSARGEYDGRQQTDPGVVRSRGRHRVVHGRREYAFFRRTRPTVVIDARLLCMCARA